MRPTRRGRCEKKGTDAPNPFKDVERMANLMMLEARASLPKAGRIIGKIITVSVVGFILASNCCMSKVLVPVGIVILAMAAGWLDIIGNECKCHRFFPSKTLNSVGASIFRWQWVVFWACVVFGISTLRSWISVGFFVHLLQFEFYERLWALCKMAVVPLALMLVGRKLEPFQFRRARSEIQKAEILVRQLAAARTASDISQIAPLIEMEKIPFYKLGSIANLLYDYVASHDATDKLHMDLPQSDGSMHGGLLRRVLYITYAPFRHVASDLILWESRDLVLYIASALYFTSTYVGTYYFPWMSWWPLWFLLPFLGPKSRAARYVRALQENIRLAQGASVEKKGGLEWAQGLAVDNLTRVNWIMVVYIGANHLAAIYAITVLPLMGGACPLFGNGAPVKGRTIMLAVLLYICSGLGITAGVHRLWAHRSYKAAAPLRLVLMIFNSIANQGSIYHWARDHRLHHLYSDSPADPHDSNRGFWFSHVGWLLVKKNQAVTEAGRTINISDLKADPIVMFQKKADPFWNLMWCYAFPAFTALLWEDSLYNGFLIAGVFRYVFTLNVTWAVNSVVHAWGSKPYNPSHLTTENGWVSLFALGEGWHNWHHAFSWDYSASELEPWLQYNPTKVFIDAMARFGLVWDRKRALGVWETRKARWEEAQGRKVLESLEGPPLFKHRIVTFGPTPYDEDDEDAKMTEGNHSEQ